MNQAPSLDRAETKTRILDAAERIFARDGFDAASLRTITAEAQANLAAVNYHFQTKEALFAAAIGRRIRPVNERRFQMLDALGEQRSVLGIVDAFIRPALEAKLAGGNEFTRPLMARMTGAPDEMMVRIFREHLEPMLNRFVAELCSVLPGLPEQEIRLRWFFVIGSMAHTMAWSSLLPKLTASGGEIENLTERLIAFTVAGLSAPFAALPSALPNKESRQRAKHK